MQNLKSNTLSTSDVETNTFLYKTYVWMFFGLLITAVVAYILINSGLINFFIQTPFSLIGLLLIQIGIVLALTNLIHKISTPVAGLCFLFYSIATGITITPIVYMYTNSSVTLTFIAAGLMFAFMAAFGYFTKQDLSTFGSISIMGLIGIIIGAILNMFFNNSILHWIITYAGITIFLILTAYDMQKLKDISFVGGLTKKHENNIATVGALTLYLDLINLFIYSPKIFWNKK